MFKSVAAVKGSGTVIFGFGFKSVAACGDAFLDKFKKFRADPASSIFLFDVYFLDPNDFAARLLRVCVGKNAVADGLTVCFKDEGISVWHAR